jgi:hypothetical protein
MKKHIEHSRILGRQFDVWLNRFEWRSWGNSRRFLLVPEIVID